MYDFIKIRKNEIRSLFKIQDPRFKIQTEFIFDCRSLKSYKMMQKYTQSLPEHHDDQT